MNEKPMINKEAIVKEYQEGLGICGLCKKYHLGKLKIKKILIDNGVEIKKRGGQAYEKQYKILDWKIEKYPQEEGYEYIAKTKDGLYETKDYMNNGGFLTSYINKKYNIEIPSLYDRREYYKLTGNYWWEEWFDIIKIKKEEQPIKNCPYCDWKTIDIENKSGAFEQHLKHSHNKTIDIYLKEFPDEIKYFNAYSLKQKRLKEMHGVKNFTICPLCHTKFKRITEAHLQHSHNLSTVQFRKLYPDIELASETLQIIDNENHKKGNLVVSKNRFISSYERKIQEWLKGWGISFECNRQMLIGKEIDILAPDFKIGIEFDGLKFHAETFGHKDSKYHLDKTVKCNENGYSLVHIFEDEFVNHEDIVKHKLMHFFHIGEDLEKIQARKKDFTIKEIYKHDAQIFLDKFHIQGYSSASVYIGGFWKDQLVAVMAFKYGNVKNPNWELVRFATDYNYIFCGVGGKMFNYFIKEYQPKVVVSFADRRWTLNKDGNLYTKLNFKLEAINRPDYRYYNDRVDRYKRVHKMTMNKRTLSKKYGFPLTMTEKEMTKELGYDRIWDCGLFKYVWRA